MMGEPGNTSEQGVFVLEPGTARKGKSNIFFGRADHREDTVTLASGYSITDGFLRIVGMAPSPKSTYNVRLLRNGKVLRALLEILFFGINE